ncbi:hypothetical protein [Microbulbifer sp. ARAS458-1]|uniref:hypothetical protein n=1 Tax=Microbulbifer sp. ARAS458-1 TaxID=3140242 RepID=UPI003877CC62
MKFEQRKWCEEAESIFDDFLIAPERRQEVISEVQDGRSTLWKISGGQWETWLITRLEKWPNGCREMVLEAVRGRHIVKILRHLFRHYKAAGVNSVRFATPHPEAVATRLVKPLGLKRVETVFRVEL